ncbi:hypothetical protein PIB30_110881, partial [Stylosanthes scabra]|nr:hypothetical protein [Stylosanthes scabra]
MHAFFNKFITRKSSLIQLVRQYDNCLRNKEQKEREADFGDFNNTIPCAIYSSIEAQFEKVDQRYVLERWSKKVKRNHTNISSSYDEPVLDETTQRYNGALSRCFEACQVGSKSEGRTAIVHRGLDRIFSELQQYEEEEKEQ